MSDTKIKELAKMIKIARISKGWTQSELAKKSKICETTICFLENAKKCPRPQTLLKIAKALKLDVVEVIKYMEN